MSRSATRLLQQTIEAITCGGGAAGQLDVTCNCVQTSDLNSIATESTATDFTLLADGARIFGYGIVNNSGSAVQVIINVAGNDLIHTGELADQDSRFVTFSPNYVTASTDIQMQKNNTGSVRYTLLYHDLP